MLSYIVFISFLTFEKVKIILIHELWRTSQWTRVGCNLLLVIWLHVKRGRPSRWSILNRCHLLDGLRFQITLLNSEGPWVRLLSVSSYDWPTSLIHKCLILKTKYWQMPVGYIRTQQKSFLFWVFICLCIPEGKSYMEDIGSWLVGVGGGGESHEHL